MKKQQLISTLGIMLLTAIVTTIIVRYLADDAASMQKPVAEQASRQETSGMEAASVHDEEDIITLPAEVASAAGITIATAAPAHISTKLILPGEIRFNQDRTAHIVPRVDGIVESVDVDIGQQVKRKQLLATIASTTISELRSDAMAAQKRLTLARTIFEREKELWQEKISAEQDYLQAQQALQEAEINVQNTQQKLQALGTNVASGRGLNRYELRAPFSGLIVERHITLGESVQANVNIMTLADLSSVWAEIVVSARDLSSVQLGSQVTVKAASINAEAKGVVAFVGALLGEQSRTATARVTLQNPGAIWRPGLFVNVEVNDEPQHVALAVAAGALQQLAGRDVVFVQTGQGFKPVAVTTGRRDGQYVEILSGLDSTTRYVAQGSFILKAELGKASAGHEH